MTTHLHQTTIHSTYPIRDARAIHRTIEHTTHGTRTLWAQPQPRLIILRTTHPTTWADWPHTHTITRTTTPTRHPTGTRLNWALIANPTLARHTPGSRGQRTGITDPTHATTWAQTHLHPALTTTSIHATPMPPTRGGARLHLARWAYSGTATVTDPDALSTLLTDGVGRGKAFGCGLLLLQETP